MTGSHDHSAPTFKALTQDLVNDFRRRGYLVIGKLFDDKLIKLLQVEYDSLFTEASETGRYSNLAISDSDDIEEKKNANEQMLQIMQCCERNIHFRKLLYDDRILDIVEDLIGPNIQLFHDQAL